VIVKDGKGLMTLMKRDLLVRPDTPDLSFHTPFPILESDSDSSISKGRRQKTDVFKEIPSNIEVQREGIHGEDACLQLTFDGKVIAVGEGQAFPDFCKTLKKHRRKMRRDALKLTFDGSNVMSVREGQAFSDCLLRRLNRNFGRMAKSHADTLHVADSLAPSCMLNIKASPYM
jgi:hypothetical protein